MIMEVKNLSFSYHKTRVLSEISFVSQKAEIISFIGENGSGKSTLIRCLCGLLPVPRQHLFYNERDLMNISISERARLFAYVPQRIMNNRGMSAYEYLLLGRKPYFQWGEQQEDLDKIDSIIEDFSLNELAFRLLGELSGGELQKIVIARSFVQDTKIIFLDEPSNNLDIRYQLELMEILKKKSAQDRITIFMAVHDLNLVYRYSDRVALLKEGLVFTIGTPEETMTEDNLLEVMGVHCRIEQGITRKYISPERFIKKSQQPENGERKIENHGTF